MSITLDGTSGITTPDVDTDGLTVDTNTLFVDAANNRVGVGTSSPGSRLSVSGNIEQTSTADIIFTNNIALVTSAADLSIASSSANIVFKAGSGNPERARIPAGGGLLVSTTSVPAGLGSTIVAGGGRPVGLDTGNGNVDIKGDAGGWGMQHGFIGSSGTNRGGFGVLGGGDAVSYYWVGPGTGGPGVQLAFNGTAWAALSDEREKNIYGAIENALSKILQVDGVYYNYKSDDVGTRRRVGFSAQKVQAVLPEAVTELPRDPEDQTDEAKRLSLSATDMLPLLVQAIKEQQAIIEALEARVAALEDNA
jgi:hypothetical protein